MEIFVIEGASLVAVGVVLPYVIIVAIRGTVMTHVEDLKADITFPRVVVDTHLGQVRLHKGFLTAASELFAALRVKLASYWAQPRRHNLPIYLTGHSLGGAMAAVTQALWSTHVVHSCHVCARSRPTHPVIGCYTFGMPRYGDLDAVSRLDSPWCIYRRDDMFPPLPPKWLGYADAPCEFALEGGRLTPTHSRKRSAWIAFPFRFFTAMGIRHHRIEGYTKLLAKVDGCPP